MTLQPWAANGWLKQHAATRAEIAGLIAIVARDLGDASKRELSADWRFGIAYNAVLKLCLMLVPASGHQVERSAFILLDGSADEGEARRLGA